MTEKRSCVRHCDTIYENVYVIKTLFSCTAQFITNEIETNHCKPSYDILAQDRINYLFDIQHNTIV